jgi:threonine dehydratase
MQAAIEAHHPVTVDPATTIADGIAVRRAGDLTLPLVERYVDEIVTVEEDEIASAILMRCSRAGRVARAPHQPARSAHRGACLRRQH